jgi:hypothetical protein
MPPSGNSDEDQFFSSLSIDPVTDLIYAIYSAEETYRPQLLYFTYNMSFWQNQISIVGAPCAGNGIKYGGCGSIAVSKESVFRTGPDYTKKRSDGQEMYFMVYVHDKVSEMRRCCCFVFVFISLNQISLALVVSITIAPTPLSASGDYGSAGTLS